MLIPLWGQRYYEQWLCLAAPSLLAPGNIPHLQERADFELVFLCKSQDQELFRTNALLRRLGAETRVKTIVIDEFFPPRQPLSYSLPLTLAFAKGIHDLGQSGLGTFVIAMKPDFILSSGSLAALLERLDQGYDIVAAPSLRVVEQEVRPLLEHRFRQHGEGCFSARRMMAIAEPHLHQTVRCRIINRESPIEAWSYHIVYWRLSASCLAGRSFLLQPLCFQVRRQPDTVVCAHDYGFLQEYCPGGRYAAIGDSDELLMVELQARDSEAELLEPAAPASSPEQALERRIAKIVAGAAQWTTAEHRRGFAHPLLFHSTDPPPDAAEQLAEFDRLATGIGARLPPPLSAVRHFQWLPAVHLYRAALSTDGAIDYPDLIKDDANRSIFELSEIAPAAAAKLQPQWVAAAVENTPEILAKTLAGISAVVTLDGLINEVWALAPTARVFPVAIEQLHSPDREMTFLLPRGAYGAQRTLCLYLLIASLPHWPKLSNICDAVLAAGGSLRVVFREQSWAELDLRQRDNRWMLSLLERYFEPERYSAAIALIPADHHSSAAAGPARSLVCRGFVVDLRSRPPGALAVRHRTKSATPPPPETLTAVIPAHNRVGPCTALVRFLRACGFAHRVIVADSSTPERASALRAGISGLADYRSYDYRLPQYAKLARIAHSVETPHIVLLPDDDILFPHAIAAALLHLKQNPSHVAAHGYSLRFGMKQGDFDIYQVEHFIPTIDDADPMARYALLMQRYQPHIWAVFRTEVYAEAMTAAAAMPGTLFQELMFQIVSILSGPVARLPVIYAMRGMEVSQVAYSEVDPFQWLLADTQSLFQSYFSFREALAGYLHDHRIGAAALRERFALGSGDAQPGKAAKARLAQLLDLMHASYLARTVDFGTLNHAIWHDLGKTAEPVRFPGPWAGWSEPRPGDLVRHSQRLDRRYIWRQAVLQAEPRDEIMITPDEIERVEAELDGYVL